MYNIEQIRRMNCSNRRKFRELGFTFRRMNIDYRMPFFDAMVELQQNEPDTTEKKNMSKTLIHLTRMLEA